MRKLSRRGFIIDCIKEGKYTKDEILVKVKNGINQDNYSTTHEMALTSIISEMKRNKTLELKSKNILAFNEDRRINITPQRGTKIQGERREVITRYIHDGKYTKAEILKMINDQIDTSKYRSSHEMALNNIINQYKEAGVLLEKDNAVIGYISQ